MEENFFVTAEERNGVPIVSAAGEIDVSSAPELLAQLDEIPDTTRRVIIDLSNVTFLDSTGLGVLISTHKRLRESSTNGTVNLVVTHPQITKVLEITGLTLVFPVFANLEEALA